MKVIDFFKQKLIYIKYTYFEGCAKTYSQEGEDLVLRRLFKDVNKGFYVDVGAYHPKRFSNTYFFYKRGWRGINIEAMPGSMSVFNKIRPRDINIEAAVSDREQVLTYYIFNEPALNGFSKKLSAQRDVMEHYYVKSTKDIETLTLEKILDRHLPKKQEIDFLSIDVEGLDFMVLKSNNFAKYKPKVILIEILDSSLRDIEESEISKLLAKFNYSIFSKMFNTAIFVNDKTFLKKNW